MNNKDKIKLLRILMIVVLGVGFFGTLASVIIVATIYGDYPSPASIVIMAVFFALIPGTLFLLIPFRKAVKQGNNVILSEYGSPESRSKTYELFYTGFEIINNYFDYEAQVQVCSVTIRSKVAYSFDFSLAASRLKYLLFSPQGFSSSLFTDFKWHEVVRIIADAEKKQIIMYLSGNERKISFVFLPAEKNILYLIKTFCPVAVENENQLPF